MTRIRARVVRGEEVKFISHLDFMKVFERALRRSNMPIAYSQGFNPHPQIVFGLPLGVGVTSEAEYVDFEFSEKIDANEFIDILNNQLPCGISILEAKQKYVKDNIMKLVGAASYDVLVSGSKQVHLKQLKKMINAFLDKSSIMVNKKTKKGYREVDIRPMIYTVELNDIKDLDSLQKSKWVFKYYKDILANNKAHGKIVCFSMLVSAGSKANLKPDLLIAGFNEANNTELKIKKIHRTGLFVSDKDKIVCPLDELILRNRQS